MEVKKSQEIGMKRGRVLSQLPQAKQLDVIAKGLPILLGSASELLSASNDLSKTHYRGSAILEGHASEEIAKLFILTDIVRCPPRIRARRIGPMIGWFYDHLARLTYLQAQQWSPQDIKQLQGYVDNERKSHYLEGYAGEFIVPNWTTYSRESQIYADIFTDEDGEPTWNAPYAPERFFDPAEAAFWRVCRALEEVGAFTRTGLDVMSAVWGSTDFVDVQGTGESRALTYEMLVELERAKLFRATASQTHTDLLLHGWQLPMYRIDFSAIDVPLTDLQSQREANLWSEYGV